MISVNQTKNKNKPQNHDLFLINDVVHPILKTLYRT